MLDAGYNDDLDRGSGGQAGGGIAMRSIRSGAGVGRWVGEALWVGQALEVLGCLVLTGIAVGQNVVAIVPAAVGKEQCSGAHGVDVAIGRLAAPDGPPLVVAGVPWPWSGRCRWNGLVAESTGRHLPGPSTRRRSDLSGADDGDVGEECVSCGGDNHLDAARSGRYRAVSNVLSGGKWCAGRAGAVGAVLGVNVDLVRVGPRSTGRRRGKRHRHAAVAARERR